MEFQVVSAGSPGARAAVTAYVEELISRIPHHFSLDGAVDSAADLLDPPAGVFVVGGDPASPTSCAGLNFLDDDRAELKRMWVAPSVRGTGVARGLLVTMERLAVEHGRRVVVLDTNSGLTEAVRLYERAGYGRVADYNGNVDADVWFAKELAPSAEPSAEPSARSSAESTRDSSR